MAEITQTGYQSIRDFVQENWTFIELRDASGNKIIRLGTDDERVSYASAPGSPELELVITVTGSDPEIKLPVVFAGSAVYTSADAAEPVTNIGSFSNFEMTSEEDQLTIAHIIEIPQQP